jgi:malate dehydrogenase (oxaloacetate-decarboxylating)(NADP+)
LSPIWQDGSFWGDIGSEYIIPKPLDGRLRRLVSSTVARVAVEGGVATVPYPAHYPQ